MSAATKKFLIFVARFLLVFGLLYLGTLAVIGLAAPGGYYIYFIANYLDYVSAIKYSLISGTKFLLSIFGISTVQQPGFIIKYFNGRGVFIAMDCVGYGVMSFWLAYVIASGSAIKRTLVWSLTGLVLLWMINVIRISLLLVAYNSNWEMPLGVDHHTWFNIAAYIAIFTMMYFFERRSKKPHRHKDTKEAQSPEKTPEFIR